MTPRYPGARFLHAGGNGNSCSFEACSWHEAVTTGDVDDLFGWTSKETTCHMGIAEDGDAGQFADFHEAVNGTLDGNSRMITVETWDGLLPATGKSPDGSFGPNDRPWTARQTERIADIIAWMALPTSAGGLDIPIRWMNTTRERGHAPHRLGVPEADGKVKIGFGPDTWTRSPGKQCPGDLRVLQLRDEILPRAAVIATGLTAGSWSELPTGQVDLEHALARQHGTVSFVGSLLHWTPA